MGLEGFRGQGFSLRGDVREGVPGQGGGGGRVNGFRNVSSKP